MGRIALCYPDRFKGAGALVVAGTLSSPDMGRDAVVTAQPMDAFGAAFGDGSVPGMYLGGDGPHGRRPSARTRPTPPPSTWPPSWPP